MLDYTKVAIKQIEKDVKRVAFVGSIIAQLIYIAYLVYTIWTKQGFFAINIGLLILSVAYFAFFLYANAQEFKATIKRKVHVIFKRCKQLIRVFTLGVMGYGIYLTADEASTTSIIFLIFMILGFIADVLLECTVRFVVNRSRLFIEAMKADLEEATKPVRAVKNFFGRISGNETPQEEPTKQRQFLDEQVEQVRDERKNQRLEKKFLKKQERAQRKAEKSKK